MPAATGSRGGALSAGLLAGLAAANLAGNLLVPGALYVPVNLAVTGALLAAARRAGLGWRALGLGRRQLRPGLAAGAAVAGAAGVALATALALPGGTRLLADRRMAGVGLAELAYHALVRIPLGTAVFEEVAFRGVLYAAVERERSQAAAVAVSSAAFGLWHVVPTYEALAANGLAQRPLAVALVVPGAVLLTAGAGGLFCLLRIRTGGVLAPVLAHAGINSAAAVAAFVALRAS